MAVEGVLVVALGLLGQAGAGAGRVLLHLHQGALLGTPPRLPGAGGHHDGDSPGLPAGGDTAVGGVVTGTPALPHQDVARAQLEIKLLAGKKLKTEGEIQSQLSFCHCSSQSRGSVTESGTLDPTVLGSGTNLTCV